MTEDWQKPFTPADFININSYGGNIGPFHWINQQRFSMEVWGIDNFYEATISELSGISAFLWTEFDWKAWKMGLFCYD